MRNRVLLLFAFVAFVAGVCLLLKASHSRTSAFTQSAISTAEDSTANFDKTIKPILQARCQPCHFPGGKMYDELPFDKAETITRLGTKLFGRIKDKKEQQVIREFLDASKSESK
ncbi:MAG TPA: hypothetical protein VFX97_15715 [Pyrinomonadaceae bacterium]|nr:hypothetical protein [Pyrinomonadaceae bacterium]